MPRFPRQQYLLRALLAIGVIAMVLLVHFAMYVGLRLNDGARLADALPFMVAPPIQYIDDADAPQAQLLAKNQKNAIVLAPNTNWVASLSKYSELPPAMLMVTTKNPDNPLPPARLPSSQAHLKKGGKDCLVQLIVDPHDNGTMAQSMMRLVRTNVQAPQALRQRLNEYEALHELGHCLHAQLDYPFQLQGLKQIEQDRITAAFWRNPKSPLPLLFRELFADAYAAIMFLNQYNHSAQAMNDLQLVIAWRALSAQRAIQLHYPKASDSVYLSRAQHATAPMLMALLAQAHEHRPLTPEQLATTYASQFVLHSARYARDVERSTRLLFTAQAPLEAMLAPVVDGWTPRTPTTQRQHDLERLMQQNDSPYKKALRYQTSWLVQLSQQYESSEELARAALRTPAINSALGNAGVNQVALDTSGLAWSKALVVSETIDANLAPTYWPSASIASLTHAMAKCAWYIDDKGALP